MAGFKKLGTKGNVVHRVVLPGPTRGGAARRSAATGGALRGLSLERSRPSEPVDPAAGRRAAAPTAKPAAAPQPSPAETRQSQRETELLQRRIEKLSRLLTEQEMQIRNLADRGVGEAEDAPIYDFVQPSAPSTVPSEKRRAFMSQLFHANLELRESVNRSGS